MQIRIRETGEVMFWNEFRDVLLSKNPSELIKVVPETEEWLNEHGADVVFEGSQARPARYQFSFVDGVEQIDGKWYTKYSVSDMDADAIAEKDKVQANSVRQQRDAKLKETDWRFRSDMTPSQEWKDYCQALRDVPSQAGFPWTIEWPDAP